MKRFENAKVGDKVVCLLAGEGVITLLNYGPEGYHVLVDFGDGTDIYTVDGYLLIRHKNPSLFYLGENGEMLTERPEPKPLTIHPEKVPVDTKVLCWDFNMEIKRRRYFSYGTYSYPCGYTSWTSHGQPEKWNHVELAEELTVDGTTYPVGTMIKER